MSQAKDELLPYIIKPTSNACGNGIRCITDISSVTEDDLKQKTLVQKYIVNPLLMDGFKVTFRMYVLVASFSPLRIYLYPEGLGRLCSERYSTSKESFERLYTHLTNYDINKYNEEEFLKNKGGSFETDSLRTDFQSVMRYLKEQGKDVSIIWEDMKDSIVKTLFSVERKVGYYVTSTMPYKTNGFEILGFDYLLSDDLKCWLLEVNHAPNLEPHTELETKIKRQMIRDALQLLDVEQSQTLFCREKAKELLHKLNGDEEKVSHGDAWNFVQTELENSRKGLWERVFPNKDSTKYKKYMKEESANEKLIDMMNCAEFCEELEKILVT